MRTPKHVVAITVIAISALSTHSPRAMVKPLGVAELSAGAAVVVRGTVSDRAIFWRSDARGDLIVTECTVDVTDRLKGAALASSRMIVELEGGQVGNVGMRNDEEAQLALGEDVVLFLVPHPSVAGRFRTYGWFQGRYSVIGGMVREAMNVSWADFRREVDAALRAPRGK